MARIHGNKKNTLRLLVLLLVFTFEIPALAVETAVSVSKQQAFAEDIINVKISLPKNTTNEGMLPYIRLKSDVQFIENTRTIFETADAYTISFEIVIAESGTHSFSVSAQDKTLKNLDFTITILDPPLNAKTEFNWRFFTDSTLTTNIAQEKLIQGETYYAVLCGAYNSSLSTIKNIEHDNGHNIIVKKINTVENLNVKLTPVCAFTITILYADRIHLPAVSIYYIDNKNTEQRIAVKAQTITPLISPVENKNISVSQTSEYSVQPANFPKASQLTMQNVQELYNEKIAVYRSFCNIKSLIKCSKLEKEFGIHKTFLILPRKLLMLSAVVCVCLLILAAILLRKNKPKLWISVTVVAFAGILIITKLMTQYAIVYNDVPIMLYKMPDTSSNTICELTAGDTVIIRSEAKTWVYIKTHNNLSGWIHSENLLKFCNSVH